MESFEQRLMLTGPQLISIIPDDGGLLLPGDSLNVAPRELTFRFDQNQTINAATLAGIELVRSGGDGAFSNANDVQIAPGFIGIGTQPNTVVMRFSTPLPDDLYQVTIVGAGPNALTNASSERFNNGVNQSQEFRLNLGPQVLGVVPQPVSLPDPLTRIRTQATNEIDVYFNERLQESSPGQLDPSLFQLIATRNTATTADDTLFIIDPNVSVPTNFPDGVHVPGQVKYNYINNEAQLIYGSASNPISLDSLGGAGAFRLRFGDNSEPQQAPIVVPVPASPDNPSTPNGTGPGDTFGTSMQTGALGNGQTKIFDSSIAPLPINSGLVFPGGDSAPGTRNVPDPTTIAGLAAWITSQGIQNHLIDGRYTSSGGVTTIPYNFQDLYGTSITGIPEHNSISEVQKQRVREIFGLFSAYSGVNFVETPHDGITVAVGDVNAVAPSIPATSVNGITGPTSLAPLAAIINGNVNWGTSEYGGAFFAVAMHQVGHALGLGNAYDLPAPNAMGYTGVPLGGEDPSQPTQPAGQIGPVEPALPGHGDVAALQYLYRTDSKDIDLYKFTLTQEGRLKAETVAQRLTPTSGLNTVLTLYNEVTLLGLPASGGQGVQDGQTFSITTTDPGGAGSTTQVFEFNSGLSLKLPGNLSAGKTFTLADGTRSVTFEFEQNGFQVPSGNSNTIIRFNAGDTLNALAMSAVQAINAAVKNAGLGINGQGVQTIKATYSGGGAINIGGDANTALPPLSSGVTMTGSISVAPGRVMVRYAPGNSQHDLAIAVANAITGAAVTLANANGLNAIATAELNQVQLQGPISVDVSGAPGLSSSIQRSIVSRNDDYFGVDSLVNLHLSPGVYYIAVSSTGNTRFDPNIADSGWGGTTNGMYELRLNFQAIPSTPTNPSKASLVSYVEQPGTGLNSLGGDSTQRLDGDADGTPGGAFSFWFNVTGPDDTIFVDKTPPSSPSPRDGSLANPFSSIEDALNSGLLTPGTNLRIEGNQGASFALPLNANPFAVGQTFSVSAGTVSATFEFTNSAAVINGQQLPDGNYAVVLPAAYTQLAAAQAIRAAIQAVFPGTSPAGDASGDISVALSSDASNQYVNLTGKLRITLNIQPPPATPLQSAPNPAGGTNLIVPRNAAPIAAGQTFTVVAGTVTSRFEFTANGALANGQQLPNGNYAVVLPAVYTAQNVANALQAAILASPLASAQAGNVAVTISSDLTNFYATLTGSLAISVAVQPSPLTPMSFRYSDIAYQIGLNNSAHQFAPLADGATFNVPRGVTVMIDPGAEFKMSQSIIDVGSSAQGVDRSQGALQVLGIPGNQVIFTSFGDSTIGGQTQFPENQPPLARGNWGGLVFRADSDLEPLGVFLNYVNGALLRYGGGQVNVNGVQETFDAIDLESSRPTITNNVIIDSAQAPISATPNSFEDTQFSRNVRFTAVSGASIVDGQTFQIHGATFEFVNINNPGNNAGNGQFKVLPGDLPVLYRGTTFLPGQTVDTDIDVALAIARAINGAQLAHPAVQAAVTGNMVTVTNVIAVDSAIALNVPFAGSQSGLAGQTFAVKGTVFQFFSGDALQVPANGGAGITDGATFTITQGAQSITFEFAANGRTLSAGNTNTPIHYNNNSTATVPLVDTMDTLALEIIDAINAAFAAVSPVVRAAYSGKGVISLGSDASTSFNVAGSGLTLLAASARRLLEPNLVPVHFATGDSPLALAREIAAAINTAQIDGGTGALVYAEAVQSGGAARVDLMNSSDVNLTSPNSAPLTLSLLSPLSINVLAGSRYSEGDSFTVNGRTFEFDSGYTLTVPQTLTIAGLQSFSISDGVNTVSFDFNGPAPARAHHVNIAFDASTDNQVSVAQKIVTAINNAGLSGVFATYLGGLADSKYAGQVNIGGVPASTAPGAPAPTQVNTNVSYVNTSLGLSGQPLFQPLPPPGIPQQGFDTGIRTGYVLTVPDLSAATGIRSFSISDGVNSILFEFNGSTPGAVPISFSAGVDDAAAVAQAIEAAINAQGLFGVHAVWLGQFGSQYARQVNIGGLEASTPGNSVAYSATLVTPNATTLPPTTNNPALSRSGLPAFSGPVTGYVLDLGVSSFNPNLSPAGVNSFSISDGIKTVIFDFNGPAQPGHVVIPYATGESPDQLAQAIAAAINNENFFGVQATWLGQFGNQFVGQVNLAGISLSPPGNSVSYAATQVIPFLPPLIPAPLILSGQPGADRTGGVRVPFVPDQTAARIAADIGTAVSNSNLGVSANSNRVGPGTVTFQNANSLVPSPLLAQPAVEPIAFQLEHVFTFGSDALPLGLQNDIFTADYQRLGPDVHGNLLALPQSKVITVGVPGQIQDGQQFVINNLGFELDSNNTTSAGFHSVPFTALQLSGANAADAIAAAIAAAINAASNPASPQYVPGFNVTATIGQPGAGQVSLSSNAANAAIITSAAPLTISQRILENTINGLFVHIRTALGRSIDTLDVSARFHSTDIVYVITSNLELSGQPGGPLGTTGRESARLQVDPGVVVKLLGSRIEVGMGANFVAEADQNHRVIFTSLFDDSFGSGGTFFTNGDDQNPTPPRSPAAGDWGGLYFWPTSKGSIDHALIAYAGGSIPIEGGFDSFNAVEIHQARVRIANTSLLDNASGQASGTRNGRGPNDSAVIYVINAQPVLIGNILQNNLGAAISINANAMTDALTPDYGRSTGIIDRFAQFDDNHGPLVRLNKLGNNSLNGVSIRSGTLDTASIWDDTDIVHVVNGQITATNYATNGGLRLQSSATQSLVVKAQGGQSGFTATGAPLDIGNRIGGTVQILGTAGHPVVITSIDDGTVGAGLTPADQPNNDTNNTGGAKPGTIKSGPVFIDGGDRDKHGDNQGPGGSNEGGWKLVEQALKFVYDGAQNKSATGILVVGANGFAQQAPTSAASALNLPAPTFISGAAISTVDFSQFRVIYVPSTSPQISGGISQADLNLLAARRSSIATFVNVVGGGLMAFTEVDAAIPYNWLAIPSVLTTKSYGGGGNPDPLTQTAALVAAGFNITDADINLGTPWHQSFTGPPGFDNMQPFIVDANNGEVEALGLPPGSTGIGGTSGPWQGIKFDEYSNDRNVAVVNESESAYTGGQGTNNLPNTAQYLGALAPNQQSGDDKQRLGFEVHGFISPDDTRDADIYSFSAAPGTQVWLDVSHTSMALDAVVELVDANGNVLARSDNGAAEQQDAIQNGNPLAAGPLLSGRIPGSTNLALPMQSDTFQHDVFPASDQRRFGSINPRDPGMRVVLPNIAVPSGQPNPTYYVRVYSRGLNSNPYMNAPAAGQPIPSSSNGLTSGAYQLQVRLQEAQEVAGSVVRFGSISFAQNGITVLGQPAHSPLAGQSVASGNNDTTITVQPSPFGSTSPTYFPGQGNGQTAAQDLGNLLNSDTNSLSVGGNLQTAGQIDWYKFSLNYDLIQAIQHVNGADKTFATIFDIGYADGLARPDTTISVFNQYGNLILVSRDSNTADDQPRPTQGNDTANLGHSSFGTLDAYVGSAHLPVGFLNGTAPGSLAGENPVGLNNYTYYVAISSNATLPTAMDATFSATSGNPLVRLEPLEGFQRIAEDHIGFTGYTSGNALFNSGNLNSGNTMAPQDGPLLPIATVADLQQHVTPYTLNDVVGYVNQGDHLYTINPANGSQETDVAALPTALPPVGQFEDISIRMDGLMFGYRDAFDTTGNSGYYYSIDPGTGAITLLGGDGAASRWGLSKRVDAMAWQRVGLNDYRLYFSIRAQNGQSALLRANPANGDTTGAPFGLLGIMDTGVDGGIAVTPVPGNQIAEGQSFKITDLAGRTITFVFHNTALPALPPPPSGAAYVNFATGDTADVVGSAMRNAISNAFFALGAPASPPPNYAQVGASYSFSTQFLAGRLTITNTQSNDFTGAPQFVVRSSGVGGFITGMSFDPASGRLFAVSSNGGVYRMNGPNPSSIQYLSDSKAFSDAGYSFQGLSLGPQNLDWNGDGTPGDLRGVMLATADGGPQGSVLTAFSINTLAPNNVFGTQTVQAGAPVAIFDVPGIDQNNDFGATGAYTDNTPLSVFSSRGIALSPLDFNLWHPTSHRGLDAGHGINNTFSNSRVGGFSQSVVGGDLQYNSTEVAGGASFYFGLERFQRGFPDYFAGYQNFASNAQYGILDNNTQEDLTTSQQAVAAYSYNLPGGASGSLETNSFSLAGYMRDDKPTLYFNYFLETRNNNTDGVTPGLNDFRDAARVYASADGGKTWQMLATNDATRTYYNTNVGLTAQLGELPEFVTASANVPSTTLNGQPAIDPRQRVQPLFNNTGSWRQARIDLGDFSGKQNVMLRFDFHTSGSAFNPTAYTSRFMQGDQYGDPSRPTRAQDLQHEGFYVDDLIVGLASRGEQVTGSPAGQRQFFTTPQNPNFGAPAETLTGPYQLQIRRGQETAQTINPNNKAIILNANQFDVNDRLASAYTLIAPEGRFNQSITQVVPAPTTSTFGFIQPTQSYTLPTKTFTFDNTPAPTGGGTLTISGIGDLEGILEYLQLDGIGDASVTQNVFFDQSQRDKGLQGAFSTSTTIQLSKAQLQNLLAGGGGNSMTFRLTPQALLDGTNNGNLNPNSNSPLARVNGLLELNVTLDYASAPFDGQTFAISDGVNQAVFELDDDNQLNSPSDIRVTFDPAATAAQLAQAMAAAINQQSLLKVYAATADAAKNNPAANANDTSDRINLFGAAWVHVGLPQVTVSGPGAPPSPPPPTRLASAFATGLDSAAAQGNRAFNGYGVLGNAAGTSGISNPRDVNLFAVTLRAGDATTVQLNAGSILSSLLPYLRIFDANGVELGNSATLTQLPTLPIGSGSPANAFVAPDPYYTFTAPADGVYYIGVSGAGNTLYDPTKPPPAWTATTPNPSGSTGYYQVHISVGAINVRGTIPPDPDLSVDPFWGRPNVNQGLWLTPGTLSYRNSPDISDDQTIRVVKYDYRGDAQIVAPQGSLILESNKITNAANDGILISASPREGKVGQGNPNLPHQGGAINTPVLNSAQLVPGVVVENNLITTFGTAGIQFSGDANPAGAPQAVAPFGRLINNTIYGAQQAAGVGILVTNNASPTIVNNILANTQTGIQIDSSSQALASPPVLGANLYQGNVRNTNLGNPAVFPSGDPGSNGIVLAAADPLFVSPATGNFYLKAFSRAIDSSLDSLVDRPARTTVTGPLGISPSPILAPSADVNGQQRKDDPFVASPPGLGSNVFKDRGAVERADLSGPLASLLNPADNDIRDQDPLVNVVHPVGDLLAEFQIQLSDGVGAGIDNSTVNQDRVSVRRNGVLLVPGVDYAFVYDNNNHIIRLIAASGVWQNGYFYDVALDNGVWFDPQAADPRGTPLGIRDLAGNFLQANAPNGFTTYQLVLDSVQNDPPAVTLPLAAQTLAENSPGSPYAPSAASSLAFSAAGGNAITVYDVDANGGVERLTVSTAQGSLAINAAVPGITNVSGNGTSSLTFDGTVDVLNAALNSLIYTPTPYFNGQATIQIVASDLGNSPLPARQTTVFIPIAVTEVNNVPAPSAPATQHVDEDHTLTFSSAGGNAISLFDVDVQGADASNPSYLYTVELRLDNLPAIPSNNNLPRLFLGSTAGITFLAPPGGGAITADGSTDIWVRGTLSAINNALEGLRFVPPEEASTANSGQYPSPFSLTLVADDNGNIGAGAAVPTSKTVLVTVDPVTDAPTLDNSLAMTLTLLTEPLQAQTPADVAAQIAAAGGANTVASILATGANNGNPITINTLASGGALGIAITDATGASPVLGTWYYSIDGGTTWKSFGAAGTDFGLVSLNHALLLRATDRVEYVPAANFNTNGTLAALPSLTFTAWDQTTAVEPVQLQIVPLAAGGAANIALIGQGGTTPFSVDAGTASLSINAVDSPPRIAVAPTPFITNEETAISFSGASAPVVSDPDINEGNLPGVGQVSLTISVPSAQGTLSLGGVVPGTVQITAGGNGQSSITIQGPLPDVNTAINGLTYLPAQYFAQQAVITLTVNDLGNFGALPPNLPNANGGLTATKTLVVNVTPVHFAPVLNGSNGSPIFAPVVQNTPPANNAGSTVGSMLASGGLIVEDQDPTGAFLALDVDAGAKQGIAVTGLANSNGGSWYYSTNGGASYVLFGSVSASSAVLLRDTDRVRFLPNQNFTGTVTLTFRAWDQTDGAAAGGRVNLTLAGTTGGKTAYSTGSATATLTVTPIPLPPSFNLRTTSTVENDTVLTPGGANPNVITVPGFAYGISPGTGGTAPVSFTVTDYNNDAIPFSGLFAQAPQIDASGTLTYQLNADKFGVATLKVTASNGTSTSASKTTTITIMAIDNPPTLDPIDSITVLDNAGQQQVALTGITAGINESQVLTVAATSSNPAIVPNPTISYTSPNQTGFLFFTPVQGQAGTVTITVTVTDNGNVSIGNGQNTVTQTFTITVQNTSPVATAGSTPPFNEGTQATITLGGVNGVNNSNPLSAIITSLPTGGTLYQTSDGFTRGAAITSVPTAVTSASNQVIYVPNAGQFGSPYDSFGFAVTDGTQTSASATQTINVLEVNQAPSFTAGPNVRVLLGTTAAQNFPQWATNISKGAAHEASQTLNFLVTGNTNPGMFIVPPAVNPLTGALTYRLAPGATGSATITLVLKDNGGTTGGGHDTSAPQSFTISVVQAPTANPETYIVNNSGASFTPVATGVLANDSDQNVGGTISAVPVSLPTHGQLTLNSNGSFTYVPNGTFQGLDHFTYRAADGSTSSGVTTVTIYSHEAAIVQKFYQQVLNRNADDSGLQYWATRLHNGEQPGAIAQGIFESNERLNPIISQYYQQFLLRPADAGGLAYWRDQVWKVFGGPEHVISGMISSREFFASAGGANVGWVTQLYQRLLNRTPDTQGLQFWVNQLNQHAQTQEQVVLGFVSSDEYFSNLVNGYFQQYLQRSPSASEAAFYLGQFRSGASQRDVQISIVNLPEYLNNPASPAPGSSIRLLF